jgi:hypothetical protein
MDSLPASYVAVIVLAFLSGGTTLIGVSLAITLGENPRMIAMGIGFSTGIMVLISLCELVPEALRIAGPGATSLSVGLGAALILTLHILIPHIRLGKNSTAPARELRAAYLEYADGLVHDVSSRRTFRADELTIIEHYRFEGSSDPDDSSVCYAVEAHDGTRGILADAYGVYANPEVSEFLTRVPIHEEN